MLDAIDKKIVQLLAANGRMPNQKLAEKVGLSQSACSRRVKILEDRGIIQGYEAKIDRKALGLSLTIIVQIGLEKHDRSAAEAFEFAVKKLNNVFSCEMVSGRDDYIIRMGARDIEDYGRIHREQLSQLPGVARIESTFAVLKVID